MDIVKLTDRVRSEVDKDKLEALTPILKEIEVGVVTLIENVKDASAESKARKLKIREMQGQLNDNDVDIDELRKKADTSELTAELKNLKVFKAGVQEETRTSFLNRYNKVKNDPRFEKASSFLKMPEAGENGEMDFTEISNDDMASNLTELKKLDQLDYFSSPEKPKEAHADQVPKGQQDFGTRVKGATSMADLEKLNEEMAGA